MKMKELMTGELKRRTNELTEELTKKKEEVKELEKKLVLSEEVGNNNVYALEKKFNGFRAVIHKSGQEVKIFSDQGKDITFPFPTIVEQSKQLSTQSFILDCELVPYDKQGNPQGRSVAAEYIGAVKSHKDIDDSGIIFHVFDVLYFGDSDLLDLPWNRRSSLLKKLNFANNIKLVRPIIVDSVDEAQKGIEIMAKLKGSEGCMVKRVSGKYSPGEETDAWIKYRTELGLKVRVSAVNSVSGTSANNYTVCIDLPKTMLGKFNPKYVDNGKLMLGNTFNTDIKARVGDILYITVEEVWRHSSKDGKIRYSLHKPNVRSNSSGSTSTPKELDAYVVARGVEVTAAELDEVPSIQEPNNFPDLFQADMRKVMESEKEFPFVMQWHYRGHETKKKIGEENANEGTVIQELDSLHTDFRMEVDDHLDGITILSPTSTDRAIPDNLKSGSWKNIRCVLKVPQPKIWLGVEGIYERGAPGTTANADAVFVITAKGTYKPIIVEDHRFVVELNQQDHSINKEIFKKAESKGIIIKREPEFRTLPKRINFHIAHIGDRYLILSDEVNSNE
jgi:hypothetical protein